MSSRSSLCRSMVGIYYVKMYYSQIVRNFFAVKMSQIDFLQTIYVKSKIGGKKSCLLMEDEKREA